MSKNLLFKHDWPKGHQTSSIGENDFSSEGLYKKFTNCLMKDGNQNVAEKILAKACIFIKLKLRKRNHFIPFLDQAVRNVKPLVELQSTSARYRKRKPKAIPMPWRRGEKPAIG